MKRFKNKNEFNQLLSEYRTTYYLTFLSMFFLLTLILGVLAFYATTSNYLEKTKMAVVNFVDDINILESDESIEVDLNPSDPRMVVAYAYVDSKNKLCYEIKGSSIDDSQEEYRRFWQAANIQNPFEEFVEIEIGGYQNISYAKELNAYAQGKIQINGYNVKFIKVFMNVQGELDSRSSFIKAYMFCAIIMISISGAASIFMSKQTLAPLKNFVQKQVNFVSDASHELRTPLAVIQSKIEMVLANPNKTVYDVSEELAVALNEINRLNKLTNELLTLARNDKNKLEVNLEVCNLNETVKKIIEPFREIMEIHNREFEYEAYECYARVDKDKLKQIMIILIDNAIKYTNEEDKITIYVYSLSNEVRIEVVDTGLGMSDEAIKHVFERFYREDKARSRSTGGTGLGLSIAYTLVQLHKGTIKAAHNNPKGSRLIISLPRVKNIK